AADDDEQLVRRGRLARELDQLTRPLREQRLRVEPELPRAAVELGPALPSGAVGARRVDEKDRLRPLRLAHVTSGAAGGFGRVRVSDTPEKGATAGDRAARALALEP